MYLQIIYVFEERGTAELIRTTIAQVPHRQQRIKEENAENCNLADK